MKLYNRIVDYLFNNRNERKLSELLTYITIMCTLHLLNFPHHWNFIMIFISFLIIAYILYHLVDRIFRFILGKRNIEVGFRSFMMGCAVIATFNTFVN
ncbi:hypothetical protein [Bacillus sp. NEB1478]|uniref:hypothetical protein n=1 Tax=Bacillus sp. NEB1478 TaxID=3073816 RepID=UPI0028733E0E|nr:hypothetical protein [Bacillus sp. NEB1478]WNB90883.1 hypothetical protein RGB74_13290 [Bacillus sp. NEB1478]